METRSPVNAQIFLARTFRELQGASSVWLGCGLPQRLAQALGDRVTASAAGAKVEVAVVQAEEVSENGDLVTAHQDELADLDACRWIAVSSLEGEDGRPVLVRRCTGVVSRKGCVDLVITEFGVIRVLRKGFELIEVAPGVSSDHVRMKMGASLHVVDNLLTFQI